MRHLLITGLAAVCLATVSACSDEAEGPEAKASAEPSSDTLASSLNDAPGMTTVASAIADSGLAKVFDGTASYTLLAPTDDAFGKLGGTASTLKGPENRAAMAALLRDHIVPGHLTPADIDAAITAAKGEPVRMNTMGDGALTFAKNGETITVTGADGSSAKFDGQVVDAANGAAIPIDALLKKVPAAPAN